MTDRAIPQHLSVAVTYVGALLDYLGARGHDAKAFATRAGVDPGNDSGQIPARQYVRMLDDAAALTGDPNIGLHVGESVEPRHLGVQGYAVMSAATAAEALERAVRYQTLVDTINKVTVEPMGKDMALVWQPTDYHPGRAFSELDVTSWVVFSRWATGVQRIYTRAEFRHAAPTDLREHERILQCPIRFGAPREALVFNETILGLPMPRQDPMIQRMMDEYGQRLLIQAAASDDPLEQARAYVSRQLTKEVPRVEDVAQSLHMATRTLQRKLTERGMTYSALIEGVRHELAQRYLADPLIHITEIAFLLGYSEQSAFQRAFKRWSGESPGAFRSRVLVKSS
ncbi:AraC family transcriptional regulator [Solimonas sp. K1W22B-7]|uniref:AraC family transcriptional regulator n=1 Tax=Solimonas sp. K1W22B-7 TaxID=2303331 RepID=UPI000E33229D|nr:AraC family transcriptional regulator [Solimonas sp. K1W22B-7]AXQ29848.1 AraC family transcriptional regulator [Solimonas sp. K1W22B-7]